MSAQVLILLIPVLALATGFVAVLRMPRKGFLPQQKSSPDLEARVDAMEQELAEVRRELAETHERLDFAERMLTRGKEGDALPRKAGS